MISRWILFGLIYIVGGLPIGYFLIEADDQRPWLIALAAYFVIASIIGNWVVFAGGKRK